MAQNVSGKNRYMCYYKIMLFIKTVNFSVIRSPPSHLLLFDNVLLNTGNGYHPTIGAFIVPQTGVYVLCGRFE